MSYRRPEDDNPFAKYNYTRRKRQSDLWMRLAKIGGAVLFVGLLLLTYKSFSFRGKAAPPRIYNLRHDHSHSKVVRENATLLMLVRYHPQKLQLLISERNSELDGALRSMRQIEDRFNHQFHYPWVFLNDEPFTQEFRLLTSGMASGDVEYGLIEKNEWQLPSWVDVEREQKSMKAMVESDVLYGGSISYR